MSKRNKKAALVRHQGADSPAALEADTEYRTESLAVHIERVVDLFPPLSTEQRERLATLLRVA